MTAGSGRDLGRRRGRLGVEGVLQLLDLRGALVVCRLDAVQLCVEVDLLRGARLEVCREEPGLVLPVLGLVARGLAVVRKLSDLLLARLEFLCLLLELLGLALRSGLEAVRLCLEVGKRQR